ncbi:DUF2269 family protein [Salirhabdus salicampi]|uniref:DUF2269 family protein n=1 Tax=Salirhabdus salicampi TaxID=476102 RepID=UPI0020C3E809|nr:DUF2269 family protein [Salirhabdus salicampi]MCP8615280.1 DUF2269 domain-containing protein [Salirhabdus salicampi]
MFTLYMILLVIHIIAAVIGLGATFGLPVVMGLVKTKAQALFAYNVFKGIEKHGKIGSLSLLVTGLLMGFINPSLFTQIWYVASIIIYIGVQPIAAGILPRKTELQIKVLEEHDGDDLPEKYFTLAKKIKPLNNVLHISVVVLILLMTVKPF